MSAHVLAINPGATSTKLGIFDDDQMVRQFSIDYDTSDFEGNSSVFDQLERRSADIIATLGDELAPGHEFDAVVGRGGLVGPVRQGAYLVDDAFEELVRTRPVLDHASNLGGPLARAMASAFGVPGCPAFIYDPVTVDSMMDCARLTGIKGLERRSIGHHLNMRAVAIDYAHRNGKRYAEVNVVVVHMGGGASASAHQHGVVVDFISDDEVMFSAERSGGIPLNEFRKLLGQHGPDEIARMTRRNGGLRSLAGTADLREVIARSRAGDAEATLVLDALALQVSKAMASLAVSLEGEVDALILTGGMAHNPELCERVHQRTYWIAPLHVAAGEQELQALAAGALRVLRGEESCNHLG